MKINFLTQYYKSKAQDNNPSHLLNMYLEEDKNNGKYPVIALPTPGLTTFNTASGSVVRGGIEHRGVAYFVVDNKFYSYASNGTRTERGTLNTSTGRVQLASISNQIMIVDGTNGYNYNTGTTTFATINDADFISNPTMVTAQDEYFLVGKDSSAVVNGSDVGDGTSWNALSFGTKNGHGDYLAGIISNKRYVYVMGDYTSDIWYNSGASTFSFETLGLGAFLEWGLAARHTLTICNEHVYFLAQNATGGKTIIMIDQYKPVVISNKALDYQINQLTTWSDAFAYCYNKEGHEFYVITFPTDAVTFMYDLTTGVWSELQSYVSAAYTRHLSNCYVYCYNKHLVGMYNSGTISYLDSTVYQDNSAQIKRQIVTPPGYAEGHKIFLEELQVDLETGVGSSLTVTAEISKDSGRTYSNTLTGTIPSTGGRLSWHRLGMTQNAFVIRLSTTANAKFCVLGAVAEASKGVH